MVRATFRMRSRARAESPSFWIAVSRSFYQVGGLRKGFHRENANTVNDGGLFGISPGDDDVPDSLLARGNCGRKSAADGAYAAVERKFAQKNIIGERFAEKGFLASEEAKRHGKVERRAFLAHVGGSEIHGDSLMAGIIESAILEGGFQALAAFLPAMSGRPTTLKLPGCPGPTSTSTSTR